MVIQANWSDTNMSQYKIYYVLQQKNWINRSAQLQLIYIVLLSKNPKKSILEEKKEERI